MTEDTVIDKVMKLLAKAESTTPEEAEALLAKATELMVRHEIDEAMLASAQGRLVDEIIEKRIAFKGTYALAQRNLMFAIGKAQGFKLLQGGYDSTKTGTWVGFKRDIEAAEVLLTSLMVQQTREAQRFVKDNPTPYATAFERFTLKRSHMMGFAEGAGSIIRRSRDEAAKAAQTEYVAACPDSNTSVALVLLSKDEQVKDWYDTKYRKLRKGRATRLATSYSARNAGHEAGRRADVGSNHLGARKALGR